MAGYNRIIMVGNLTRDPELKQLTSGQSVCRLGLAANRQFKNRQTGETQQEVCFVDVDVWGAQADSCHQYLQKGRPVLVEGRLKLDSWTDQDGNNRSRHSITAERVVFLGSNAEAGLDQGGGDDVMDKIDQIKEKVRAASAPTQAPRARKAAPAAQDDMQMGVGMFNDEPPFKDELPF